MPQTDPDLTSGLPMLKSVHGPQQYVVVVLYVRGRPALWIDVVDEDRERDGKEEGHNDHSEEDCLSDEVLFDQGGVVIGVLKCRESEGEEGHCKLDTGIVDVGVLQVVLCQAEE